MKIIINADMIKTLFHSEHPSVNEILNNKLIHHMIGNSKVMSVYQDNMNANNINNYVIKVIPQLKGKKRGK